MPLSRIFQIALLPVLLLTWAACEAPDRGPAATDPDPRAQLTDPAGNDRDAPSATTEETVRALEQGAPAIGIDGATSNIDGWLSRLEGSDFPQRDEIVQGLRDLRTEVQRTPIDGGRIAEIMTDLGEWTTQAGMESNNPQVQRLGRALSQSADRIRTGQTGPGLDPGPQPGPIPETGAGTRTDTQPPPAP